MSQVNVGAADRIIRVIAGAALVFGPYLLTNLPIWDSDPLRIAIQVVGGTLALSGIFRFCMIYKLFGHKTN